MFVKKTIELTDDHRTLGSWVELAEGQLAFPHAKSDSYQL